MPRVQIAVRLEKFNSSAAVKGGCWLQDHPGGVNTIVVHSTDAGRTWREVAQTQQYRDPDDVSPSRS